ncbi:UvrD-helicase domain-containing protein [Eleftheria terrae]|uniref:UvrD-helicase domain-containing protein n=1 Tax=Eleftheria terrae TaxID=1597781 RepID=UPI00263B660A|nr:UvrD-helicase domain-containing protein [Eleftheria terrae]WKB51049.1 AAA family ATPase [Eleftheria terrae]
MATFIPEWVRMSGRNVRLKRVLNALDDEHVVRRAIRPRQAELQAVDFFVQHPGRGWLAVSVQEAAFEEIDPDQLVPPPLAERFEQHLALLHGLGPACGLSEAALPALVLMWNCSAEQVRQLSKAYLGRYGVRLVCAEQFMALGGKLITGLLAALAPEAEQALMALAFPEAEIPAACTTRRVFRRDNSATLGRLFLDPQQEWAAKLDLRLPREQDDTAQDFAVRLVNGVAGSGKTLIILHRALMLAELFPKQQVLVLIHNTPIVADLKARLHQARGSLPANLEIATFFAWAGRQWRAVFGSQLRMPTDPRLLPGLVAACRQQWPELRQSEQQLIEELDFINGALIRDEPGYLAASRAGRGFALRPRERSQVWALYEAVTAALLKMDLRMWSALPHGLCHAVDRHARLRRYEHILIDEAQFFAPSWFQLATLSLQPQGRLFLCADPNQGFMKSRLSWKSVGLDVAGRTKKLRRSYRTTRAILEAAGQVLASCGRADGEDYLEPDFTGMEPGTRPTLLYSASPQDAVQRLAAELAGVGAGGPLPLGAFLVIYGDKLPKAALYDTLEQRFGPRRVWWFNKSEHKKTPPEGYGRDYLRMAYIDSATGLEGAVVFLVGVDDLFFDARLPGESDEALAERREENARKLYMAMTRAGQQLVVVTSRRLPQEVEGLFERERDAPPLQNGAAAPGAGR